MRASLALVFAVSWAGGLVTWMGCGSNGDVTVADAPAVLDGGDEAATSSGGSSSASGGSSGGGSSSSGGSSGAVGGDGGTPADAGPGGDVTKVSCGATTCALATDTCCVSQLPASQTGYYCSSRDAGCAPPPGGGDVAALECSGQANCPANTVCCVRQTPNGAASACQATCANNEAQLCDKNAATSGCPQNAACSSNNIGDWALPPTYATCGGKGN